MALIGKGRVLPHIRGGVYIYVSKDIAGDSAFPLRKGENVKIKISGKKIVISKR